MAAESFEPSVVAPICELCWLADHARWEPESMDESGKILMRLVGVDVPDKANTNSVDICAVCGNITVAGIYEIRSPENLKYLNDEEDEDHFTINFGADYGLDEDSQ